MAAELTLSDQEFVLLRDFFHAEYGIFLGREKAYLIENRLIKLVKASGSRSYGEFYLKLKQAFAGDAIRKATVDAITTHETCWFRDRHPFVILEEKLLPQFHAELQNGRCAPLKIWSAACSTGQEPYSIALTAAGFFHKRNCPQTAALVSVLATDISTSSLETARSGRYDQKAIERGMPWAYLNGYFTKNNGHWEVAETIRRMVAFKPFNLKEPLNGLGGPFDIIFLRNVLIYFSDSFKKDLFTRLARVLSPGGHMLMGTGETTSAYTDAFDILDHQGTLYYRLKR